MNIIIMGKPGCGKGTQAKLLEQLKGFAHISTGNLIHQEIDAQTPFGKSIAESMAAGNYLDDDNVFRLLEPVFAKKQSRVFDGFPRTLAQAQKLDTLADIAIVLELTISDDDVINRIANRQMVNLNGTQHSFFSVNEAIAFQKEHGGTLFKRPEDDADIVLKRLTIYNEKTKPITQYYANQTKLIKINGAKTVAEVQEQIISTLANI